MISIMALGSLKFRSCFTHIKVNSKMVLSMDRELKCGTQIVDSLMLEKYMSVLFLRGREMDLAFAHI